MRGFSPKPELKVGGVYRDVDGSLVHLVAAHGDVCCWTPVGDLSDAGQMTHRDNFLRRFVPMRPVVVNRPRAPKAKHARRTPGAVVLVKAA